MHVSLAVRRTCWKLQRCLGKSIIIAWWRWIIFTGK